VFNHKTLLIMKNRKPQGAFFERAPNVLLEKIAELSSVLTKYRNNGHANEVLGLILIFPISFSELNYSVNFLCKKQEF